MIKKMSEEKRITVFTPTYNRANTLSRVYDSLLKQTYKNFIWVIVDDGSTDNTRDLISRFSGESPFPIKYIYQKNQGKHIAINTAVKNTKSELFIIADSDDSFVDDALEILVKAWDTISESKKKEYKGITCRCYDAETDKPIGINLPKDPFDSNDLDAPFKYKLTYEKWSLSRTEVFREFPFPNIEGGLKFYPEGIIWQKMARKYKTRYINNCLRAYYRDQENSVTNSKYSRHKENFYLWENNINNIFDYFWYNPILFLKSFVGLWRDGILCDKKKSELLQIPNRFYKKVIFAFAFPFGYFLSKKKRRLEYKKVN